jgi:hypothetical protein
MKPGEGLWANATSAPRLRDLRADVDQQQAGFLGVMERQGQDGTEPVMVAMRLKLEGGKIAEAEHIVAGLNANNLARVQTPRAGLSSEVPAANRKSHGELVKIGLSYYDALDDNDGTLMPFADDCQRHENGMITAGPEAGPGPNADTSRAPVARLCGPQLSSKTFTYIDRIENRRLIAADPVTGLSMGFSHFRHPMTNLPYQVIHTDGSTSGATKRTSASIRSTCRRAHLQDRRRRARARDRGGRIRRAVRLADGLGIELASAARCAASNLIEPAPES